MEDIIKKRENSISVRSGDLLEKSAELRKVLGL
jgi:hypothetical protein